jgi:hypothetical protein
VRGGAFVGKCYTCGLTFLNAVIDELKIFKRGLDNAEIANEMNVKRPLLN